MYKLFTISGIIAVGFFMGLFGKLELAQNGRTDYVIVKSANPTPAEKFAVEDLSAYLQKVTGARFTVVSETNGVLPSAVVPTSQRVGTMADKSCAIYVGWTEYARKQGIDGSTLGDEEWIIKSIGKNLVLTGGRPRGTLFAVYEFLEQQVGCHWLDEVTENIPSQPSLTMKSLNVRGQPAFWDREIYTAIEYFNTDDAKKMRFSIRNKDSRPAFGYASPYGSPGGCHTFYAYSKDFPTNHPEYFSMDKDGKRERAKDGGGPGQLCLTNPDVRKLMLAQLKKFIAKDRENAAKAGRTAPRVYDISQNDDHKPICLCPTCRAFAEKDGGRVIDLNNELPDSSSLLIDFINELADGIRAEYPDVLIQTFAYSMTLKPPKTLKVRDNVMIHLAQLNSEWAYAPQGSEKEAHFPDYFRPMSHPVNRGALEDLTGWSKIAKHMAYWDYWILYSPNDKFPTPYVNVACLQPDLQLFHDSKVEKMFGECENVETTSFFALKRWLGLKLMQNPEQDPKPLIKTFMTGFYGPAAGKMTEYLNYMEDRIAAVPATNKLSSVKNYERPYLDLEFYKTSQRLLDEAEAACGTDKAALLNVQRERIPVDGGLYGMWELLRKQLPAGQSMPWDHEKILQRYETTRLTQMEARRSKDKLQQGKEDLQKELQKMQKEMRKPQEIPLIEKRKAEKPPALRIPRLADEAAAGDLSKVDWNKASPISLWRNLNGSEIPGRKIKGALAHDGKYLYVSLEETLDPAKLSSKADMWSGDDWELFFAAQRGKPPYRQLAINPEGNHFDYEWAKLMADGGQPVPWTNNAVIKSDLTGQRWQTRISFPLAELIPGGAKIGQPFYINVFRGTPDPGELMCWSPTFENGFHNLTRMAELTLE